MEEKQRNAKRSDQEWLDLIHECRISVVLVIRNGASCIRFQSALFIRRFPGYVTKLVRYRKPHTKLSGKNNRLSRFQS